MPPKSKISSNRKRIDLPLEKKREILKLGVEKNKSQRELARAFGISKTAVHRILVDQRAELEAASAGNLSAGRKRLYRTSANEEINEMVLDIFKKCRAKGIPITGPLLQAKAKEIADRLGVSEFSASNGWLQKFRERNNIDFKILSGESANADKDVAQKWKNRLPEMIRDWNYDNKDVFNGDETSLFYRQLPSKSLVLKSDTAKGGKLAKERITVLFCCSATGEKLKPLVIGNAARPLAFRRNKVNVEDLPVTWRSNRKAWMTTALCTEWLNNVNVLMKARGRKILILLDNASSHPHVILSNVRLVFLPPHLTSEIQPLDQGIIRAAKALFRKQLLAHLIANLDTCTNATDFCKSVTVLDAITWITNAWKEVKKSTITNCFRRCGAYNMETYSPDKDEPIVDVFENFHLLPLSVQNQLSTDARFVDFDDTVACEEGAGTTLEEITAQALSSFKSLMELSDEAESDEEEPKTDEEEEPAGFVIDSHIQAVDCLRALQAYAYSKSSSAILPLANVASALTQDVLDEKRAKLAKLVQPTLDVFVRGNSNGSNESPE